MALRVALILGAGPNVGINVAKAFAAQGYKVAIVSRSRKDNEDTRQFSQVQADFGDPTSIKDIFATVTRELGHPSVVVYNGTFLIDSSKWRAIEAYLNRLTLLDGSLPTSYSLTHATTLQQQIAAFQRDSNINIVST
jgi:NAD(P)-dependent dehydrogenase (short-subunit alcohol dehydrogenase family)